MKKYLQITVALVLFGFLVIVKNSLKGFESSLLVSPVVKTVGSDSATPVQTTPDSTVPASANPVISAISSPAIVKTSQYKDGSYTGSVEDAYYGNVQVQATITGGKLTDVAFLQYPNDNGTSRRINSDAMPVLISEAIQAQSAKVDGVSGASSTSPAFQQSLTSALTQASAK